MTCGENLKCSLGSVIHGMGPGGLNKIERRRESAYLMDNRQGKERERESIAETPELLEEGISRSCVASLIIPVSFAD
jgi:hypothetical protein